ncbi:hypothetical protein [Rubellicoccus peritrichatus]|uniref:Sensory transduction regulator n=1 Tax=Rubellicoccus peritrichatus TaxID=3080537 RepID=A0AAQ3LD28_9BACT|nr:hypothetical protein [Puniceicoccus sp. CR14]WOO43256.1 hypothetical protein RZN69_09155 [Puniceicoccus sp. CR14]
MKSLLTIIILMTFYPISNGAPEPMTGADLHRIIETVADESEGDANVIQFIVKDIPLICIYDETHNRMRIISPVIQFDDVTEAQKDAMLESNFHGALDARYATSNGTVYAAFIHPLSSLNDQEVISAIYQVMSLQQTFGTEYSSGLLTFGGDDASVSEEI